MDNILADKTFIPDDFNPVAISNRISKQFKSLRLDLNMTQSELATKSGVSLGSIKRFETKSEISLRHLIMIALTVGMTDGFLNLFSGKNYKSIEDVISKGKINSRKRAR